MGVKPSIVIALAIFVAGCGAGTTTVLDSYRGPAVNYTAATIEHGEDMIEVPEEIIEDFARAVNKEFFEEDLFAKGGGELQVSYAFVQFEGGDRYSRWIWGGIGNAGEASLTVRVDFSNASGDPLAQIHVTGRIGSGFFGGSLSEALNKAASEAAEYAVQNFKADAAKG